MRHALGLLLAVFALACAPGQQPGPSGNGDDDDDNGVVLCEDPPVDLAGSQQRARQCGVGAENALLLRGSPYSRIVVEVDHTTNAVPSQDALDYLEGVIADLTDKPDGITVQIDDEVADPGHSLSVEDVQQMEDENRDEFGLDDTAVVYFFYVSDPSDQDTQNAKILGFAHRASSLVIFQGTIEDVSGGVGQPSSATVESAVIAHELGHVLGLVNIGTPMVSDHADPEHPDHDVNEDCIMYFANNSSDLVGNILTGGVIPDFDAECRADLAAIRDAP